MLHTYRFKNFQSFREQAEVSLLLNDKASPRGWETTAKSGQRLTTALGVLGANGAGKTALLKPLVFAAWFMHSSFASAPDSPIPLTSHFAANDEPTEIEVEAEDGEGVLWRYVLHLTRERVLHEALYRKKERFAYVFLRDWDESKQAYSIKQQGFGLAPAEARKVRANASLISTAAQYGVETARHVTDFTLVSNLTFLGRQHLDFSQIAFAAQTFAADDALRQQMAELLTRWDLGLSDVQLRELEMPGLGGVLTKRMVTFGVHQTEDGKQVELLMEEESSGTQSAYVLLSRLLVVLAQGGIALIDEIENDLHPHMVEHVLALFDNPSTNPHHAQLLFTCHSPEVLDLLQKSQVMFVEKQECNSVAYRGDEIRGLRSDDNLRAKYLAGALGAVPQI
jgi:hypothetical protein